MVFLIEVRVVELEVGLVVVVVGEGGVRVLALTAVRGSWKKEEKNTSDWLDKKIQVKK